MMKRVPLVLLLAVAATLSAPLAANAAVGALYPPTGSTTTPDDSTPAPGQSVDIVVSDGTFVPLETVTGQITGDPDASIAIVRMGTQSANKGANGAGGITFTVTLPSNAQGSYTFNAVSNTRIANPTTLTVTPADSGKQLSYTGGQFPVLVLWVGGGALALGIALIVVLRLSRRKRDAV